jgi:hypothetical protein
MNKRKHKRHNKRIEVHYKGGTDKGRGYVRNISEHGLFIGCRSPLSPGAEIDMSIVLPEGQVAQLKGIVRRSVRDRHSVNLSLNGMGVELLAYDLVYSHYLRATLGDLSDEDLSKYSQLLNAPLIRPEEVSRMRGDSDNNQQTRTAPKPPAQEAGGQAQDFLIVPCTNCGTKNKVRKGVTGQMPKCGRCRMFLLVGGA